MVNNKVKLFICKFQLNEFSEKLWLWLNRCFLCLSNQHSSFCRCSVTLGCVVVYLIVFVHPTTWSVFLLFIYKFLLMFINSKGLIHFLLVFVFFWYIIFVCSLNFLRSALFSFSVSIQCLCIRVKLYLIYISPSASSSFVHNFLCSVNGFFLY